MVIFFYLRQRFDVGAPHKPAWKIHQIPHKKNGLCIFKYDDRLLIDKNPVEYQFYARL